MRTTWKRTVVGLLLAGAVGGASVALTHPGDLPTFIPHTTDSEKLPEVVIPVLQIQAKESATKNDPAVALEWSGPAVVKVNQPTEYTLNVRNVCGQALQQVVVQVRAPKGTDITGTTPAVKPIDGVYLWDLGTLDAKTSKAVTVTLKQPAKGEMGCQAWVTLTGTSAMKAAVKEPKLAVTINAPETVVQGDKIAVEYTVTNTGDYPAEDVFANRFKNDGFCHAFDPPTGLHCVRLKPGESKTHTEEFTATSAGPQQCLVTAFEEDGLKALAETTVQVLVPKLGLSVKGRVVPKLDVSVKGPAERLIGAKGKYTVTVKNTGKIAVSGLGVQQKIPTGFKVSQAGDAIQTAETLRWFPGELAPGESKSFEFEGVTHTAGPLTLKAVANGDREAFASGECVTKVEGVPGLRMEVVDSADPVEKNGEITYEIKVANTGKKADGDVKIVCELPKALEFVSCSGPTKGKCIDVDTMWKGKYLQTVTFDPISDLAPKTEAVFKVKVKGTGTGDARFKAVMTSKHLTAPVTKEESTRVYGE